MSLFKVRDFWTFDLEQLLSHYSNAAQDETPIEANSESQVSIGDASFVLSSGQFNSIGDHDVLVCGSLRGFVCILQVQREKQPKLIDQEEEETKQDEPDRQLLLAQQLSYPIYDLKCGYFTSGIKQSIAILSESKLLIYQIRKLQVDLLTSPDSDLNFSALDGNLFSYELEEFHKFELLHNELAANIVVLVGNTESSSKINIKPPNRDENNSSSLNNAKKDSKKPQKWVQLPQRDSIVVQYVNQFIFTLIENKKVLGHFNLINKSTGEKVKEEEASDHIERLAQYVGFMPMTYMHESRGSSLIVSLSDNQIYSLPIEVLTNQAKENVMKRVALNLVHKNKQQDLANQVECKISLDLSSSAAWSFPLPYLPLKMLESRRNLRTHPENVLQSQLLVMSRYNLDLFSSLGEHLWSQRFEAPLICLNSYLVEENCQGQTKDKMFTMLCSDSVDGSKSSLILLKENLIVWSALLNCKPMQIMRANLSKMRGVLITLENMQLSGSYLGTNVDEIDEEFINADNSPLSSSLTQLETLDEPLFDEELRNKLKDNRFDEKIARDEFLEVDFKLEAFGQWPEVRVESCVSILPGQKSRAILQDLTATLEFDELLGCQISDENNSASSLSDGVIQFSLGSLWPDRREPLKFTVTFTARDTVAILDREKPPEDSILPRTLQVKVYLRFNEARVGPIMQEESFLLPLNLLSKLLHIDYSSGSSQSLNDVQTNLNSYKRSNMYYMEDNTDEDGTKPVYYLCDTFVKTLGKDLVDLVDEIIESDLVCRGLNAESIAFRQRLESETNRKQSTLENINLLAQSPDCRLKFKPLRPNSSNLMSRQTSEDNSTPVIVSIALKVPSGSNIMKSSISAPEVDLSFTTVWLHLCDLSAANTSQIAEEVIKQHMKEWKSNNSMIQSEISTDLETHPILVTIESEFPMPVLFVQSHILVRLFNKQIDNIPLKSLTKSTHNLIKLEPKNILEQNNFVAFSGNLLEELESLVVEREKCFNSEFPRLKANLSKECFKLQVSTKTSLTIAKKLFALPEAMHQNYNDLNLLIKQYQANIFILLNELQKLKKLNYEYGKLPEIIKLMLGEETRLKSERIL